MATLLLLLGKAAKRETIELNEAVQQPPRWIDLHRQAALSEIDLDLIGAFRKTPADLLFMLMMSAATVERFW